MLNPGDSFVPAETGWGTYRYTVIAHIARDRYIVGYIDDDGSYQTTVWHIDSPPLLNVTRIHRSIEDGEIVYG